MHDENKKKDDELNIDTLYWTKMMSDDDGIKPIVTTSGEISLPSIGSRYNSLETANYKQIAEKKARETVENILNSSEFQEDLRKTIKEEAKKEVKESIDSLKTAIINQQNNLDQIKNEYSEIKNGIDGHNIKLEEQAKDIDSHDGTIKELKKDLENQKNRIPEIVGLFSAIISLILIDVSIIKSASNFLSAILLITALTCSMAIFAVLIHSFFAKDDKIKFGKLFWIPIIILMILNILGGITYFFKMDLYQNNSYNNSHKDGIKTN